MISDNFYQIHKFGKLKAKAYQILFLTNDSLDSTFFLKEIMPQQVINILLTIQIKSQQNHSLFQIERFKQKTFSIEIFRNYNFSIIRDSLVKTSITYKSYDYINHLFE